MSKGSRKSKASYVDDTLFGKSLFLLLGKKGGTKTAAPVVSLNEIWKIRQETEQGVKVDGIIISQTELDRIKRST